MMKWSNFTHIFQRGWNHQLVHFVFLLKSWVEILCFFSPLSQEFPCKKHTTYHDGCDVRISHTAQGISNMTYALGLLSAFDETSEVEVFIGDVLLDVRKLYKVSRLVSFTIRLTGLTSSLNYKYKLFTGLNPPEIIYISYIVYHISMYCQSLQKVPAGHPWKKSSPESSWKHPFFLAGGKGGFTPGSPSTLFELSFQRMFSSTQREIKEFFGTLRLWRVDEGMYLACQCR